MYFFLSVIELSSFISHYFFIESSSPWVVIDCHSSSFPIPLAPGGLLVAIPSCYLTAWCTETPYFPGICWGHSSGLPSVQLGLAVLGFLLAGRAVTVLPTSCLWLSSLSHCWCCLILTLGSFLWSVLCFNLKCDKTEPRVVLVSHMVLSHASLRLWPSDKSASQWSCTPSCWTDRHFNLVWGMEMAQQVKTLPEPTTWTQSLGHMVEGENPILKDVISHTHARAQGID